MVPYSKLHYIEQQPSDFAVFLVTPFYKTGASSNLCPALIMKKGLIIYLHKYYHLSTYQIKSETDRHEIKTRLENQAHDLTKLIHLEPTLGLEAPTPLKAITSCYGHHAKKAWGGLVNILFNHLH